MELSVVLPYRRCPTGIRERNLRFVLRWLAGLPVHVIVVEHAEHASLAGSLAFEVAYLHVPGSGPFSKAVACNAGFTSTSGEVVAFIDADIVLDSHALLASARSCLRDREIIRPFGRLVDLDAASSDRAVASGALPALPVAEPSDRRGSEHIPLCGGAFVIRRTTFASAGGMDEEFEGWGGEDDALSVVLGRLGVRRAIARRHEAVHLWHGRDEGRLTNAGYAANVARLQRWATCPDAEFTRMLQAGRSRLVA